MKNSTRLFPSNVRNDLFNGSKTAAQKVSEFFLHPHKNIALKIVCIPYFAQYLHINKQNTATPDILSPIGRLLTHKNGF